MNVLTILTLVFHLFADCRICVWNAVDGSLVHSLTGHTDSVSLLSWHDLLKMLLMAILLVLIVSFMTIGC